MDKNQKLALNLFRPIRWRYMEKLPENIDIFTSSIEDFGNCNVIFKDRDGVQVFSIVADEEWYLSSDGKFYEDPDKANYFTKDLWKDGAIVKQYHSIRHRALEAIAFVLQGRFPKVSV